MKIQFESNLSYQNKAISSIVDIFEGQEICQSNFSVAKITDNLFHSK
jgi:type III restriction enzyme